MTAPEAGLSDLVEQIYAAALDPGRWTAVTARLAGALDATSGFVHLREGGLMRPLGVTANVSEAGVAAYAGHFAAMDPWAIGWQRLGSTAGVFLGSRLASPASVAESEFYRGFARAAGIFSLMGAVVREGDKSALLLAVHRPISSPDFTEDDAHRMGTLLPHFARALQIHAMLSEARLRGAAAFATLDRLAVGVVLIDERAQVTFCNTAAESLLRAADGVMLQYGKLRTRDPVNTARLQEVVHRAIALARSRVLQPLPLVRLPRPNRRPLTAMTLPIPADRGELPPQAWAAVFFTDPELKPVPPIATLAKLYDLTPAQSQLMQALITGERVADYTGRMGVSSNTTHTHLKQLFARTGTNRQSELIAQALRDLAGTLIR